MSRDAEQEGTFARALLDAEDAVPSALAAKDGHAPTRRFGVYRNNVYKSLIDALASRYPAASRLVGEDFFRAAARLYVEESPPRSAVLLRYGEGFCDFIADFPPAATVPYLADVMRLEWAWHAAYHAGDAATMDAAALSAACADAEKAVFTLHPSLQIVRSAYPVISIWERARQETEDDASPLPDRGEDALVLRPALEVEVRHLPPGGASFIEALQDGIDLTTAATRALEKDTAFDLQANLAGLISAGAIVGAGTPSAGSPQERAPRS